MQYYGVLIACKKFGGGSCFCLGLGTMYSLEWSLGVELWSGVLEWSFGVEY